MSIKFEGRVALVTGAGRGLGRSHALALAKRGARVVVNDLGTGGQPSASAVETVALIQAQGGQAIANGANVASYEQAEAMVQEAIGNWGRLDILVNNAGILRDKTFAKMDLAQFEQVVDVHLKGAFNCTRAAWTTMREQQYGRVVMTTSSSGLYGNFGQSNYGAAKMALVGLMNTLVIEGEKYGIRINCLAPAAKTAMTEGLLHDAALDLLQPEDVTTGLLVLCAESAPNRTILCAGAGSFASTRIYETRGIYLAPEHRTPENVHVRLSEILDPTNQEELTAGPMQTLKFAEIAADAMQIDLGEAAWGPGT